MVAYMDKTVGKLIDQHTELKLREDTLVLFYSDNGIDRCITSTMTGDVKIQGVKALPIQSGVRVPPVPETITPRLRA